MAEVLLLNPRRRKARRANPVGKAKRRRRNPMAARRRVSRRRSNPFIAAVGRRRRRRNPIGLRSARRVTRHRRRNPIGGLRMPGTGSIIAILKEAAIGGAGSLVVDFLMVKANHYLPASLRTSSSVGIGDAFKAVATVMLGTFLNKPTRGLSRKMAAGALVVQARDVLSAFLPAGALGYANVARVIPMSARTGPNRGRMGAYVRAGSAPQLLNAYNRPGSISPMLNGAAFKAGTAASREGVQYR